MTIAMSMWDHNREFKVQESQGIPNSTEFTVRCVRLIVIHSRLQGELNSVESLSVSTLEMSAKRCLDNLVMFFLLDGI